MQKIDTYTKEDMFAYDGQTRLKKSDLLLRNVYPHCNQVTSLFHCSLFTIHCLCAILIPPMLCPLFLCWLLLNTSNISLSPDFKAMFATK